MPQTKVDILKDHKSHYLERVLNRNPLLRFSPNSTRIDLVELFLDVPDNALVRTDEANNTLYVTKPDRLLERLLQGDKSVIPNISTRIIPKLYKMGIKAKEISRITGQHALFLGYPILEITQENEKNPIYAPLFLIPIKEDGLGARNRDLLIQPLKDDYSDSQSDRPEIKPNIILKQWLLSKYNENIQFHIEEASEMLSQGSQDIQGDFNRTLKDCLRDWKNVDNRNIRFNEISQYFQSASTVGARLVNTAILAVADFKGQSLIANIDEAIKLISCNDADLGTLDNFLEPIKSVEEVAIQEPSENSKFMVCYSDPSQEKVIWKVRDNELTVIQGPPGTGKSQTIVNIIADALAKKQRVAVFSQKRAALDIIHKRAKRDGFGELCLLLEDANKQRKIIIENIKKTTNPEGAINDIEISRNEIALEVENSESFLDRLLLPYIKQDNMPYRYADIMSRQKSLGLNKYNKSHKWALLVEAISSNKFNLDNDKEKLSALVSELFKVGYADSPWRHHKLDTIDQHDIEVVDQKIQTILSFFSSRSFLKTDVAVRSEWLLTSTYFDQSSFLFGLTGENFNHYFLSDAISYFNQALEGYTYRYHDVVSGLVNEGVYVDLASKLGQSHNVLDLKRSMFKNPIYQVLHDAYLEELPNWINIIELAYLEHCKKSLKTMFPDAYKSVTEINLQKSRLQISLSKKRHLDRECVRLSFSDKLNAVESLSFKDSLRLRGNSKTRTRKTEIRDLFNKHNFDDLMRIYPVLLCNPETACAVLPLTTGLFDLVIIDEASQMFVAEALPLLYRGKRIVVAGDSKQMPPSDFFSSTSDDEEWLEEEVEAEPIADNFFQLTGIPAHGEYCLLDAAEIAVKGNNGRKLLEIHYRSAASELIAFSNHAFYDGKLQCPPANPRSNILYQTPIVYKHVKGLFNKGENEAEAIVIVDYLRKLWSKPNPPTCGVIVFNVKQQAYIERLLEELSLNDPDFMILFERERSRTEEDEDVGFFVRSVEHVQGDERDLIIIGTTYSGDTNRFGPLSKASKGRRRLNVAITRAKQSMLVISSLNPRTIRSSYDEVQDSEFIFLFLAYARAVNDGDKDTIERILTQVNPKRALTKKSEYDSLFEQEVAEFLISNNYEVESQVGEGGFRIDLAIRNPSGIGYICGIECDGAIYHSGWKARFNDIWRQNILESKGWSILRIWSTDWYNDRKSVESNILKEIEKIIFAQSDIFGDI